jgi:acyl carrier protein
MQIVAQVLDLPPAYVQRTSDFFQLGGDSDSLKALLSAIEQSFQVLLAPSDVFDCPVLFRLAAVVHTRLVQRQHMVSL